jgi:hypothetical protein
MVGRLACEKETHMTPRNRIGALVVSAATLAGLAAGRPASAEARDSGVHRGRPIVVGSYGFPHRGYYRSGWGYYGPYHRYHRFGWGSFGSYYDPYFDPWAYEPPGGIDMNVAVLAGLGAVELDVKPGRAEVSVDGKYVAEARDLDGYPSFLWLPEGVHRIAIYKSGYARFERDVDVRRGIRTELKTRLEKGESEAPSQTPEEDP